MHIKSGLQYKNLIFKTKTIKYPQNKLAVLTKIILWYPYYLFVPKSLTKKLNHEMGHTNSQFVKLKSKKDLWPFFSISRCGNKFIVQDRLIPLRQVLKDKKKIESYLDKYFDFTLSMWKKGFFEETFNFSTNYGLDSEGDVKLIDVGEFCFNKQQLVKYIQKKSWLRQYSYWSSNKQIRKYFKKRASEVFTLENLDEFWISSE